jgi:hypothetical protein
MVMLIKRLQTAEASQRMNIRFLASAKGLPVSMNVYFGFTEIIVSVRLKGRAIDANI